MEDQALAAAAADGDQDAFTQLIERRRSLIYAVAFKIALNEEDALDITQNVFLRLVRKIGTFRGRGTFRGWVAAIAANEAMSFLRCSSRREIPTDPEVLATMSDRGGAATNENPGKALDAAHRRRMVEAAMAGLSAQQRAIFALRFHEDMMPREIAQRLDLPAKQVRSQLHRAIVRLRETIGTDEPPSPSTAPGRMHRHD